MIRTRLTRVLLLCLNLFLYSTIVQASACYKSCHGHGVCSKWNTCDCFEGYEGVDCAKKSCPAGPNFADIASGPETAHAMIECSGQGSCDYNTGLCRCNAGYSGLNCGKTYCLNNCNGHGQCISLGTAAFDNDGYTLNRTTVYSLWDAERLFGCKCDYGFQGPDCSQRICEYGVDPRLSTVTPHEIVTLVCNCLYSNNCYGRFKLRLFGQELKGVFSPTSTVQDVLKAILTSPGVYQNSSSLSYVSVDSPNRLANNTICAPSSTRKTKIRFRRNYGDLPPLSIVGSTIRRGSVYFETQQTLQCNCLNSPCNGTFRVSFDGEMSSSISSFNNGSSVLLALRQMKTIGSALYSVSASTDEAICVGKQSRNFTITFQGPVGNAPKIGIWSSIVNQKEPSMFRTNRTSGILSLFTNDGREDSVKLCNGIGACDFSTGQCECPPGWGFDPDLGTCGRFSVNSSVWTGIGRCPGVVDVTQIGKREKTALDLQANYPVQIYVSMNPDNAPGNLSAIYVFPWIAEQAQGAQLNRGLAEFFLNLTSNQSAGPLVLDSAGERIFFIDNNPHYSFIGVADQFNNAAGNFTMWYHFTYKIFGFTMDAYFGRRKLYWTVPGGLGLEDGAIYWAYADSAPNPTVHSLTATIGQHHLYNPRGIAIHYVRKRIYWVDRNETGHHGVLRSCDLDGNSFRQDNILTVIDNQTISMNLTDLVIHFTNNDTVFLIDSAPPAKMVAINLDAPINFNNSDALDPTLYEFYYSPRLINVTSPDGGLYQPLYLSIDERNQYLLWTEPWQREIKFSRYVHTIWEDVEGSGIAYNGHITNVRDPVHPYRYSPVAMVFDRGLGPSRWGQTADCYGNGVCGGRDNAYVCECHEGYQGDCQTARCPVGKAWFSEPAVDNIAHDVYVECSNMGVCDRRTGFCECRSGYEGAACERSSCAGDPTIGAVCFNKGKCRSMRELALTHVNEYLEPAPVYYGATANSPTTWDADMVYGCMPDKYGWYNAEYNVTTTSNMQATEYYCPAGYNRRLSDKVYKGGSYANFTSLYEIQQIICSAYVGSFQFLFRGDYTSTIYANATSVDLQRILQQLSSIGPVSVSMSGPRLCSDTREYITNVTFLAQFGNVPLLQAVNSDLRGFTNTVTVTSIQSGTAASLIECSGHGECDRSRGMCKCWDGYGPSDGLGNVGRNPDCGYNFK